MPFQICVHNRRRSACVLAVIVAGWLTSPAAVPAGDWPTVHHDAQRSGLTADSVRGPYRLAWTVEFPGESVATRVEPIVAAGRVYVGTLHGTLWALDRATGTVSWKHPADGPILHSPAFAEGRVFCGDAGGRCVRWRPRPAGCCGGSDPGQGASPPPR